MGIGPKSLCYGFLNEIVAHPWSKGVPKSLGSDVPNLMKDIPNFVKDIPNFVKDVPKVPKCDPKWGSAPNNFVIGF